MSSLINFLNPPFQPTEMTDIGDAYNVAKSIYARFGIHITEEEFNTMLLGGEGSNNYINAVNQIINDDTALVVGGFDKPLFQSYISMMHQISSVKEHALSTEAVLKMVDMALMHNLLKMSNLFYAGLKAMKGGNVDVDGYVNQLAEYNKSKGNRYDDNIITIAPNTTFVISHVNIAKNFMNRGDAELKVYKGSIAGTEFITVYPHTSAKLPAGYTTILVKNLSAVADGVFSVRQKQ